MNVSATPRLAAHAFRRLSWREKATLRPAPLPPCVLPALCPPGCPRLPTASTSLAPELLAIVHPASRCCVLLPPSSWAMSASAMPRRATLVFRRLSWQGKATLRFVPFPPRVPFVSCLPGCSCLPSASTLHALAFLAIVHLAGRCCALPPPLSLDGVPQGCVRVFVRSSPCRSVPRPRPRSALRRRSRALPLGLPPTLRTAVVVILRLRPSTHSYSYLSQLA